MTTVTSVMRVVSPRILAAIRPCLSMTSVDGMALGGALMVAVGVAMVTGWWDSWMSGLRLWSAQFVGVI